MVRFPFWIVVVIFADVRKSEVPALNWKDSSLVLENNPILKTEALPVDPKYFSSLELEQLTAALAQEMFSHFGILGIAAPQKGVGLRLFLLRSSFINPFNRSYEVFINPVATAIGDVTDWGIEFCLSASGFYWMKRHRTIQLEFLRIDGTKKVTELTGSRARIAQHEVDHLDGKLISDK